MPKNCAIVATRSGRRTGRRAVNSNAYGRNFPSGGVLSLFVLIASTFNASGFFLSREASPRCAFTTCSICVIRDRKAWLPASRLWRRDALAVIAIWYASRASVKRCTCSMNAVADLVNLFIASVYVDMDGVAGVLTLLSLLNVIGSLIRFTQLPFVVVQARHCDLDGPV